MKNYRLNDEQLKKWISDLPKIKDSRSSAEIWDGILTKKRKKAKQTLFVSFFCTAALAAAIFLFFFGRFNSIEDKPPNDNSKMSDLGKEEKRDGMKETYANRTIVPNSTSEKIITVGLLDKSKQHVIPLSFKGSGQEPVIKQIDDVIKQMDLAHFGLDAFRFQDENFRQHNGNEVTVDLSQTNVKEYFQNEKNLTNVLKETFRWQNFEKMHLFSSVSGGNLEKASEIPIKKLLKKAYFLFMPKEGRKWLLVPSEKEYRSIGDAVAAMQRESEEGLLPSIDRAFQIEKLNGKGGILTVTLKNTEKISNSDKTLAAIEAILMTAKEFGFKRVKFEGIPAYKIGNIDITKPVEVPFSPNFVAEPKNKANDGNN